MKGGNLLLEIMNEEVQYDNCIIYAGSFHTLRYIKFFKNLNFDVVYSYYGNCIRNMAILPDIPPLFEE